ncbi:MAG: hypothetical protein ACYDCL_18345 [Myxococcales bacterium]
MNATAPKILALLSCGLLAAGLGCGRSLVFNPVGEGPETSSSGGTGSGIGGSSTGGSSAGNTSGGETSGGTTGTSGGSSSGACRQVGEGCGGNADCCGEYCKGGVCSCNVGNRGYPCLSNSDCCVGATCAPDGTCRNEHPGTGGSSGGGTGCSPGSPPFTPTPCKSAADCICPMQCTPTLAGQSICEYGCQQTADCPLPYTICQRGSCQPNVCGLAFGPQNGSLDGTCNSVGTNDGSCIPISLQGFSLGLCFQGGTATASCNPQAERPNLSESCPAGQFCAGATCAPLCNPNGSVTCPSGDQCYGAGSTDPALGFCFPSGGSTSGGSTGGTTSGGTTGGCGAPPPSCVMQGCSCSESCQNGGWFCSCSCPTSGGGIGGIGGGSSGGNGSTSSGGQTSGGSGGSCNPNVPVQELASCVSDADCGCPTTCVYDAIEGSVCEYPCSTTSECPTLYTICTGTSCTVDLCGVALGGPPNGTIDGACNSEGTGDGTCIPVGTNDAGITYGICAQAGQSTTSCQTGATRSDLSQACAEGYVCSQGGGNTCYQLCNPKTGSTPCAASQQCIAFDGQNPELGICYPP